MTYEGVAPEELPLFRGLTVSRRTDLLRNAMVHSVSSSTVLFEQGDVPNFQLVVLAGSVQLFGRSAEGREVLIEAVGAPDLIIPAA
ncbi:MAG: Crp/Fnr family transcriptional regulator, partial [Alphaproteobacteria bacterium]|nr:Crp/Fnr family transcriptional regulator [Alphaproteobacteria bacterium]